MTKSPHNIQVSILPASAGGVRLAISVAARGQDRKPLNLNRPLDRRLWGLLGDLRGTGSIVPGRERVGQLWFANREGLERLGGL